ncbi:ATP-binding protein [Xylophilus sp. GW821-FHT01B05]
MPRSLAAQLLLVSVGAVLLVLALVGGAVATALALRPSGMIRQAAHADRIAEGLRFDAGGQLVAVELPDELQFVYDALPKDASFRVLDAAGVVRITSLPGPALEVLAHQPFDPARQGATTVSANGITLRVQMAPVQREGRSYVVQFAQSDRLVSLWRESGGMIAIKAALAASLLALVVVSAVVVLVVWRMLKPLRDVSAVAAGIAPSNLALRLDAVHLPCELVPLIDAFNQALARLERGYRVQQEFLAAAAHELKTPLSLIRAEVELGGVSGRDVLLRDLDFMARQIHQLLHLAEVSESHNYVLEPLDAAQTVADALDYLARLVERRNVHVELDRPAAPVLLQADGGALFILVKNLLENALHHAPPGSTVQLRVDAAGIAVQDAGAGIAAEDLPHLFTRFWRGKAASYEGAGLGLAICQEIAQAHGWGLRVRAAQPLPGTVFLVDFGG